MKLPSLSAVLLFVSATSFAVPTGNTLIRPDHVETDELGKVVVTFTLPCKSDDSAVIVTNSDDSGDLVTAVGVVYSQDTCRTSGPRKFVRTLQLQGVAQEGASVVPMDVRQQK